MYTWTNSTVIPLLIRLNPDTVFKTVIIFLNIPVKKRLFCIVETCLMCNVFISATVFFKMFGPIFWLL